MVAWLAPRTEDPFSLGLVGHTIPFGAEEAVVDALHGFEDLGVVGAVEGRVSAQEDEHDHPDGPQVAGLVVPLGQNYGAKNKIKKENA